MMKISEVIKKKRDGFSLSQGEIDYFVNGYTDGSIPDYQISALLMAIFINKMDDLETLYLTKAMIASGESVDLSNIRGMKVDKHSTGGVGDTTTLILGPMVAACGVPFVKMSGRGLGHTGGTLDKLESIKKFNVNLAKEDFLRISNKINISICSQTANITPADKKLYALRDVTATVDNLSLIASSIMSKKLAIKSDGIVLDVKVGSGAFMKRVEDARELAKEMVKIGKNYGRNTLAILTNMNQPLGYAIGNSLEVKEAIKTLKGNGPKDLLEICLALGSKLLVMAKKVDSDIEGRKLLAEVIRSGQAYNKFLELVSHQNGDISMVENPDLLPKADHILEVKSKKAGFVESIDAEMIGQCAQYLGAGREALDSSLDLSVGLVLNKKVGHRVAIGETLAYIHTNNLKKGRDIENRILSIYQIDDHKPDKKELIIDEIYI